MSGGKFPISIPSSHTDSTVDLVNVYITTVAADIDTPDIDHRWFEQTDQIILLATVQAVSPNDQI